MRVGLLLSLEIHKLQTREFPMNAVLRIESAEQGLPSRMSVAVHPKVYLNDRIGLEWVMSMDAWFVK